MVNRLKEIGVEYKKQPIFGVNEEIAGLLGCSDYFLAFPLQQPKAEIADYVESHGILVPKRFKTLQEAIASGKDFIIRSDFSGEYNGKSGEHRSFPILRNTYKVYREREKRELYEDCGEMTLEVVEWFYKGMQGKRPEGGAECLDSIYVESYVSSVIDQVPVEKLFRWLGIENIENYSFWEYIEGSNHTIVADRDVKDRYYIFTRGEQKYFAIIQSGKVVEQYGVADEPLLGEIIKTYEKIRNLPKFDSVHAPIMEFQSSPSKDIYFLQYHRGNSKYRNIGDFTLERPLEPLEYKMQFVRGKTYEEGIELTIEIDAGKQTDEVLRHRENDFVDRYLASEIEEYARNRTLHLQCGNLLWFLRGAATGHNIFSSIFKSDFFVLYGDDFLRDEAQKDILDKVYDINIATKNPYPLQFRFISDGNTGYIKLLTSVEKINRDYEVFCGKRS